VEYRVNDTEARMTNLIEFQTERLQLRQWQQGDRPGLAAMSADPRVMQYFTAPLTRAESDALCDRLTALIAQRGWGFWAVELKPDALTQNPQLTQNFPASDLNPRFLGFVGLHEPQFELPGGPSVEVGWRLRYEAWGQGFATEAAQGALRVGFTQLQLPQIVSFTALGNRRSQAVMQRLGMVRDAATFAHPKLPADSPLREHCLYRLRREQWPRASPAAGG
jgi:RimJ/RimL family protein N-acetyltransferase